MAMASNCATGVSQAGGGNANKRRDPGTRTRIHGSRLGFRVFRVPHFVFRTNVGSNRKEVDSGSGAALFVIGLLLNIYGHRVWKHIS